MIILIHMNTIYIYTVIYHQILVHDVALPYAQFVAGRACGHSDGSLGQGLETLRRNGEGGAQSMLWGPLSRKKVGEIIGKSIGNHGISWEYHGNIMGM